MQHSGLQGQGHLKLKINDMEKKANFYDQVYLSDHNSNGIYALPWYESPFSELYIKIADLIPSNSIICDFGCGTGQLSQCLIQKGKLKRYFGYDFSSIAVIYASIKNYRNNKINFILQDITVNFTIPECDVYILCEVLEHIDQDFLVIKNIPAGKKTVISLPNYPSDGHVRHFTTENSIISRYSNDFQFNSITKLIYDCGNCHWIIDAVKIKI